MRVFYIVLILFGISCVNKKPVDEVVFSFGAIADCQYCNQPTQGQRFYKKSLPKLNECVKHFNTNDLEYVVHLGDFIDNKWESFDTLLKVTQKFDHPFYHVLGNHDFSVADNKKLLVPKKLGLINRYYDFKVANWRFIVVDGNDVSTYAWPKGSLEHNASVKVKKEKYAKSPDWNGAIGKKQMAWLQSRLKAAEKAKENVILYCHFPVYPIDVHCLWNAKEVVNLLEKFSCVKAWINGHNHHGNYGKKKGIHYITLKGMVDTEKTSYAFIKVMNDSIEVKGVGRQKSMSLKIR